jgi:hypothetical protein
MIKDYCKASITWKPKTNSGYGASYGAAETVDKVYFEPQIKLNRGQDNTTSSEAMFITYENKAFMIGDYIEHSGRKYTITAVSEFYQPRSVVFDHLEVDLREIQSV